jgi:hypothetical protein
MRMHLLALLGAIACDSTSPRSDGGPPPGLTVLTATTGSEPDGDGYTILVDRATHGTIGANDSVSLPEVGAGSHAVELADIEYNCATLGSFTRTASVGSDAGALVDYSVACEAAARSRLSYLQDGMSTGGAELFLVNADGSHLTSLTDSVGALPMRTLLSPVSWSGDGKRIAFFGLDRALYATTGEGTGVVRLAPFGMSPIWSADGRKVAFLAAESAFGACCWDIFVAESDGSAVTQVTDGLTLTDYDFAADGSLLVHVDDITTPKGLVFIAPDGAGRREIAPPGVRGFSMPALSRDGSKVAYVAATEAQFDNAEIFVSPTDGSNTAIDVSHNPGWDWSPAWSPDGTRIAFVSSETIGSPGSIHVVNADGTGQVAITPVDMLVSEPAWSPDGTRIAYSGRMADDRQHIFVANADGSGRSDITPSSNYAELPTWTGR